MLGFAPDVRVLIVNCDDFGMHDAINAAVVESIENSRDPGRRQRSRALCSACATDSALRTLSRRAEQDRTSSGEASSPARIGPRVYL